MESSLTFWEHKSHGEHLRMIQRRKVQGKIIERQVIGAQEIGRKKPFHELLLDSEPTAAHAVSHVGTS